MDDRMLLLVIWLLLVAGCVLLVAILSCPGARDGGED